MNTFSTLRHIHSGGPAEELEPDSKYLTTRHLLSKATKSSCLNTINFVQSATSRSIDQDQKQGLHEVEVMARECATAWRGNVR
jgi:hypothetical protein